MKMGRRPKSQRLLWGNEWERVAGRRREEKHLDLHPDRYLQIWIYGNICQVSGSLNYSFFPPLNWVLPRRCRTSETIRGKIQIFVDIWVLQIIEYHLWLELDFILYSDPCSSWTVSDVGLWWRVLDSCLHPGILCPQSTILQVDSALPQLSLCRSFLFHQILNKKLITFSTKVWF